uniref:Uncharacterized protein n=1 Tax=Rhizophora mucronata TaxID=61149 RepID=A0A2P2PW53_RHIMU
MAAQSIFMFSNRKQIMINFFSCLILVERKVKTLLAFSGGMKVNSVYIWYETIYCLWYEAKLLTFEAD